ncbi:MAG: methyltransferase domain-containing protein, partial [Victivallaceae bacterium]
MSDKNLIRQRFHRGLQSYDQAAVIQHVMARKMVATLEAHTSGEFKKIFEIGCGAGVLTRLLPHHLDYQELVVNDLVPECVRYLTAVPKVEFLPGDIEQLSNWPKNVDLILSNAVFQWLNHPESVVRHCRESLLPGGILYFSSFGPENMRQIRAILGKGLRYHTLAEFCDLVKDDFEIIQAEESCSTLEFNSPLAVL